MNNRRKDFLSRALSTSKNFRCTKTEQAEQESSLYVRHDDNKNVAVVDIDLDLDVRLGDPGDLIKNVKLRNMEDDIDVGTLVSYYKTYKGIKEEGTFLECERLRIAGEMKNLVKNKIPDQEKKQSLIAEGKEIREKIKSIQTQLWDSEAEVMLQSLKLPAEVLPSTEKYDKVADSHGPKPDTAFEEKTHEKFREYVQFSATSPGCCYLHGPVAKLEMELSDTVGRKLRQAGLVQVACPDMAKTLVMEGCGEDFINPQETLLLQPKVADIEAFVERGGEASNMQKWDIMLYLCGGSSLPGFAGYFCKSNVLRSSLPLKLFSTGRHYTSGKISEGEEISSLLDSSQSTQVSMFAASDTQDKTVSLYNEFISLMWNIYKAFAVPVRMVNVGAPRLKRSEGARTDIEAWLPSSQKYIKVASVGYYGQFVSRRLVIKSSDDIDDVYNKDYLHMVYGTALETPRLIQVLLEHDSLQGETPC